MSELVVLVGMAVALAWPVRRLLVRASWTRRAPRAALALWQAIGLATGVSILGACLVLAEPAAARGHLTAICGLAEDLVAARPDGPLTPSELFGLTAGLIVAMLLVGSLVLRALESARTRAHQSDLVGLVGDRDEAVPGALVVEHPHPFAYCIGGRRARIVVSSGAVDALADDELEAVLAHEHAHARAHHDLVLLPFTSLHALAPDSRAVGGVLRDVCALVEMAADDRALRASEPGALARALVCFADADVAEPRVRGTTAYRVARAVAAPKRAYGVVAGATGGTTVVLALPVLALCGLFGR